MLMSMLQWIALLFGAGFLSVAAWRRPTPGSPRFPRTVLIGAAFSLIVTALYALLASTIWGVLMIAAAVFTQILLGLSALRTSSR